MYYDPATCMYYGHSTCTYYDRITCTCIIFYTAYVRRNSGRGVCGAKPLGRRWATTNTFLELSEALKKWRSAGPILAWQSSKSKRIQIDGKQFDNGKLVFSVSFENLKVCAHWRQSDSTMAKLNLPWFLKRQSIWKVANSSLPMAGLIFLWSSKVRCYFKGNERQFDDGRQR